MTLLSEKDKNLEEQKMQQYHLAQEGESSVAQRGLPNFLLQPDCVLLCSSQRFSRLRSASKRPERRNHLRVGRLYPIPEPPLREAQVEGLVTSDKMHARPRKELNDMRRTSSATNIHRLVNRLHVPIVLVLSLLHVGLACVHDRDSGRADRCS